MRVNRSLRFLMIVGLVAVLCLTGWGDMVQSRTEAWNFSAVNLRFSDGFQAPAKIILTGARNEHLFLPIVLENASSSLKARVEGPINGLTWKFFRVVPVPLPSRRQSFPLMLCCPWEKTSRAFLLVLSNSGFPSKLPRAAPLVYIL